MNSTSVSNIAVMTLGITALTKAVEFLSTGDYVGAGVSVVLGLGALWVYEHLPMTPPTLQ